MPSAEERECLIDAAVKVHDTFTAYTEACNDNVAMELEAMDWPVADLIYCANEARRRVRKPSSDEDELLSIFESSEPGIRQRYAKEREAQFVELNAAFEAIEMPENVKWPVSIETGHWDFLPEGGT